MLGGVLSPCCFISLNSSRNLLIPSKAALAVCPNAATPGIVVAVSMSASAFGLSPSLRSFSWSKNLRDASAIRLLSLTAFTILSTDLASFASSVSSLFHSTSTFAASLVSLGGGSSFVTGVVRCSLVSLLAFSSIFFLLTPKRFFKRATRAFKNFATAS